MFTTSCTAENLRLALTETACSEHVCTKLFYSKQTFKHNSSQRERANQNRNFHNNYGKLKNM